MYQRQTKVLQRHGTVYLYHHHLWNRLAFWPVWDGSAICDHIQNIILGIYFSFLSPSSSFPLSSLLPPHLLSHNYISIDPLYLLTIIANSEIKVGTPSFSHNCSLIQKKAHIIRNKSVNMVLKTFSPWSAITWSRSWFMIQALTFH